MLCILQEEWASYNTFEEVQVEAFVAVFTVFAGVAGIVQTIVLLVERSERKWLERSGRPPSIYGTSSHA